MKRFALVLLALLPWLASCTSTDSPEFPDAAPQARSGGVLRVGIPTAGSVDPGNVYEPSGDLVVRTMCTPLLAADPKSSELQPAIVDSWLVTDGGAGLTLRIREGVRFSDGTPLTAEDVAFTLTRIASAEFASTSADRLSAIAGYPEIHGDVATDDENARRRLAGVELRDERTLQISLRTPNAEFIRVLTSALTAPVSQAAAEADPSGFVRSPVCVGPYRLEAPYAPGDTALTMVRSSAYEPTDMSMTGGGVGYAESIEFRFYPDIAAAAAARVAGEVDIAPASPEDTQGVQSGPGPAVEYIGLPTTSAGYDSPAVRRALSLAIDREALVRALFPNTREPATGFLPRTSPFVQECPSAPSRGDVAGARALLAEVGADPAQLRPTFYFNDELGHRALVEEVTRQWRDGLGIEAAPAPLPFADYLARGEGRPGFDGPFRFSWSTPFPDADGYLSPLFTTDRIGRDNFTRFSDPAFDEALLREARRSQDPEDRAIAYRRVADLLCDAMPMIPVTTAVSRWSVSDRIGSARGAYLDGATGQPLLRELYLR